VTEGNTLGMKTNSGKITDTQDIKLELLSGGAPGITPKWGACLAEAASFCLQDQKHSSGVRLRVDGDYKRHFRMLWISSDNQEQLERCWRDAEVTTELGAYGIATLIVPVLTQYAVIERSRKGTGFDYWLGEPGTSDRLFQNRARLEVSGIRKGDESQVRQRVRQKIRQTNKSDGNLPAVIAVVEFSTPRSRVVNK
jgi:hypothetical protein